MILWRLAYQLNKLEPHDRYEYLHISFPLKKANEAKECVLIKKFGVLCLFIVHEIVKKYHEDVIDESVVVSVSMMEILC